MIPKDLICALLLMMAAGGYYAASLGISRSALADEVGATGLPSVYAAALAALAMALAIKSFLGRRFADGAGRGSGKDLRGEGVKLLRAAGMLAIGVGYIAAVNFTGYALTLVAVIALVAVYQGERMTWRLAGIAAGGGVLFYGFFSLALGIDMPSGFWPAVAGR
ncbi:MAG: tripartite tricarboxylate transporter TctB family protein [Rhodospirillaceae bacterium]|nr:tripartite tricarboxylate transporter TctB family protein [Rhodospirillaceae bacterium]